MGFTAWNYSQKFLNINGRVSLFYSLCWGILGVLFIKVIYPWMLNLIQSINKNVGKKIIVGMSVFLVFDLLLTFSAVDRAREKEMGLPPNNVYEKVLDKTFNEAYLRNMFNNNFR